MNIFAVSFFGHRQLTRPFEAEKKLEELIQSLLAEKEYVEFIVGRSGEFDQLTASVIRRCRRTAGEENSSLVLVLPYETAEYRENKTSFEEYYSEGDFVRGSGSRLSFINCSNHLDWWNSAPCIGGYG